MLDGKTAVGVTFRRGRRSVTATAKREVILAAGAIGSPALLQRSGIGPAGVLQDAGVALQHELAGVGENLQDHLEVLLPIPLPPAHHPERPAERSWQGVDRLALGSRRWRTRRHQPFRGWCIRAFFEHRRVAGCAAALSAGPRCATTAAVRSVVMDFRCMWGRTSPSAAAASRSSPRGREDAPRIRFQYLADERDVRVWRSCIRLTQRIMAQPALAAYRDEELQPGAAVRSAAEIDRWVRNNAESAYHPCGACRMGAAEDDDAVVDPQCRVRGLAGLRVVDSSVFPGNHQRQSERSHHHGRRTRRRHDPRQSPPGIGRPPSVMRWSCAGGRSRGWPRSLHSRTTSGEGKQEGKA